LDEAVEPEQSSVDVGKRIAWIAEEVFHGNEAEMARILGCSQSTLSRIVRGEAKAGPKIVRLLITKAAIDPKWLRFGRGEKPRFESGAGRQRLGVVTGVEELVEAAKGKAEFIETRHVDPWDFSSTRVFLRVKSDDPMVKDGAEKILPGDTILFELGRKRWIQNPNFLKGKLCVARCTAGTVPITVRVASGEMDLSVPGLLEVRAVGFISPLCASPQADTIHETFGKTGRQIEFRDRPRNKDAKVPVPDRPEINPADARIVISAEDVVAVAMHLFRSL
jgi:hypothetical protein